MRLIKQGAFDVLDHGAGVLEADGDPQNAVGVPDRQRGLRAPLPRRVVAARWVIIGLASPRLLEMSTISGPLITASASSLPPTNSKVTTVPHAYICPLARSCFRSGSSHGNNTGQTLR